MEKKGREGEGRGGEGTGLNICKARVTLVSPGAQLSRHMVLRQEPQGQVQNPWQASLRDYRE